MNYYTIPQYFLDNIYAPSLSASDVFATSLSGVELNGQNITDTLSRINNTFTTVNSNSANWENEVQYSSVGITLNGTQSLSTGIKGDVEVPYTGIIRRVTLLSNLSGVLIMDIWKCDYASFPPVIGQTITGTNKPTLSGNTKYQDSTLTTWSKNISSGDILRFNVDQVETITRAHLILQIEKV